MSRLDVVLLLKEAFRRQQLDNENIQLVRSEVASYLTSRYSPENAMGEEFNQFREKRHEIKQRINQRKQLALQADNSNITIQNTKPKTLLQSLPANKVKENPMKTKFPFIRPFTTPNLRTASKPVPHTSSSNEILPTPKNIDVTEEKISKQNSNPQPAPWYMFQTTESSSAQAATDNMNPTTEMKIPRLKRINLRQAAIHSNKLTALGEATLNAVRERKEKKERALAIAKMEARQAKIAELKARAEAALKRAKDVLAGLV